MATHLVLTPIHFTVETVLRKHLGLVIRGAPQVWTLTVLDQPSVTSTQLALTDYLRIHLRRKMILQQSNRSFVAIALTTHQLVVPFHAQVALLLSVRSARHVLHIQHVPRLIPKLFTVANLGMMLICLVHVLVLLEIAMTVLMARRVLRTQLAL